MDQAARRSMLHIYGIGLHAAACLISAEGLSDLCHDLAWYSVWAEGAPPESVHTPSERRYLLSASAECWVTGRQEWLWGMPEWHEWLWGLPEGLYMSDVLPEGLFMISSFLLTFAFFLCWKLLKNIFKWFLLELGLNEMFDSNPDF